MTRKSRAESRRAACDPAQARHSTTARPDAQFGLTAMPPDAHLAGAAAPAPPTGCAPGADEHERLRLDECRTPMLGRVGTTSRTRPASSTTPKRRCASSSPS
nr:hypothetical protein [Burkholderia ubonensis]